MAHHSRVTSSPCHRIANKVSDEQAAPDERIQNQIISATSGCAEKWENLHPGGAEVSTGYGSLVVLYPGRGWTAFRRSLPAQDILYLAGSEVQNLTSLELEPKPSCATPQQVFI